MFKGTGAEVQSSCKTRQHGKFFAIYILVWICGLKLKEKAKKQLVFFLGVSGAMGQKGEKRWKKV